MTDRKKQLAMTGYLAFMSSGVCAISAGIIVSILQDKYGFAYSLSGTLLSVMSVGNMLSIFAAGVLPGRIGTRRTVLSMSIGYFIGYLLMAFFGNPGILIGAFLLAGIAKGCAINICTVLVGENSANRTRGMSLLHAFYAIGAMVCPFLVSALLCVNTDLPMVGVAVIGLVMWLIFFRAALPRGDESGKKGGKIDFSFMKEPIFWMLTALIFMQNSSETAVTGWLVSYYKSSGILNGTLSTYTVTIMWCATLVARLLIAFVFRFQNSFRALAVMGAACSVMYFGLMNAHTPIVAVVMLFGFAFSMAGVNPVGMASVGKLLSATSVGVLLTIAGFGQIVMPWIIGIAADSIGLQSAMSLNLIPCIGILVMSVVCMAAGAVHGSGTASA